MPRQHPLYVTPSMASLFHDMAIQRAVRVKRDSKGFVADIQAALRSLDTASEFYPTVIDHRPFQFSLEDARELDSTLSGIRSDLVGLEMEIYSLVSQIVESAKEGILKKVTDAIGVLDGTRGAQTAPLMERHQAINM